MKLFWCLPAPVPESWQILLYGGYREETLDEVNSDSEIVVNQLFAGGRLTYSINDSYDVNLSFDHTVQESVAKMKIVVNSPYPIKLICLTGRFSKKYGVILEIEKK